MAYAIDYYAVFWKKAGYRVIHHIGLAKPPPADIAIVHIDLSVIPPEYVDLANRYPKVINGKILDISRRRFSQILLSRTDTYPGIVIVKSNANFGGVPELQASQKIKGKDKPTFDWGTARTLNPMQYPVFSDIKSVPTGVWENENLVVEPFIRNREGGLFYVRYYIFFGDKEFSGRIGARDHIAKFRNSVVDEEIPLPEEVRQWRQDLNIDFGRFDYLESQGQYFLIDVNKTEGGGTMNYNYPKEMEYLASGVDFYLS